MNTARRGAGVVGVLVAFGLLVVVPASAAEKQEVSFQMGMTSFVGTTTHANDNIVKSERFYFGLAGGSPTFSSQSGATLEWTVNQTRMRGTVSGVWAISGNIVDVF